MNKINRNWDLECHSFYNKKHKINSINKKKVSFKYDLIEKAFEIKILEVEYNNTNNLTFYLEKNLETSVNTDSDFSTNEDSLINDIEIDSIDVLSDTIENYSSSNQTYSDNEQSISIEI